MSKTANVRVTLSLDVELSDESLAIYTPDSLATVVGNDIAYALFAALQAPDSDVIESVVGDPDISDPVIVESVTTDY